MGARPPPFTRPANSFPSDSTALPHPPALGHQPPPCYFGIGSGLCVHLASPNMVFFSAEKRCTTVVSNSRRPLRALRRSPTGRSPAGELGTGFLLSGPSRAPRPEIERDCSWEQAGDAIQRPPMPSQTALDPLAAGTHGDKSEAPAAATNFPPCLPRLHPNCVRQPYSPRRRFPAPSPRRSPPR
jgi:hypothetical protein